MIQHTILNNPIRKLRSTELKKVHHISPKLKQSRKTKQTELSAALQSEFLNKQPIVISDSEEPPKLLRDPELYLKIQEVPIYEPSEEELTEPFLLFKNIREKGFEKYGAVKIKAPKKWSTQFAFNPDNKPITTRKQVLKNLIKGKPFEYKVDEYTLDEFKQIADKFAKDYTYHAPFKFESIFRANEYEYWAHVEDPQYARYNLTVEYAADLPSKKYGSGFPTVPRGRMTDDLDPSDLKTHPFNLNNLTQAKDSLFQIITTKTDNISGISSPWVYAGMLFASFCWHVEDMYMFSVNYMHKGSPKTWYCVPPDYKEAFDATIKEKYGELFIMNPALLYNITQTMNPQELTKRNIPVYRTEQNAGEIIITFPKVYHAGFSHGFNVAEAVNVAAVDWVPFAKKAMEDYALDGFNKKGSFPYEWIIVENVMRIKDLDFTKEAREKLLAEYEDIKGREFSCRDTVQKCYTKIATKKFPNASTKYDVHMCGTCKNYTYLSFLSCTKCKRTACTQHITVCDCLNPTIVLMIRFSNEELDKFLIKANEPDSSDEEDRDDM